jgi:hypothetical protein
VAGPLCSQTAHTGPIELLHRGRCSVDARSVRTSHALRYNGPAARPNEEGPWSAATQRPLEPHDSVGEKGVRVPLEAALERNCAGAS